MSVLSFPLFRKSEHPGPAFGNSAAQKQAPIVLRPALLRDTVQFGADREKIATGTPQTAGGEPVTTIKGVQAVLDSIEFKPGYRFVLKGNRRDKLQVQVQYVARDVTNMAAPPDWRDLTPLRDVPKSYSAGQIEQLLLGTIYSVDEHELRENFHFKGLKIFNPHFKPDDLTAYLLARSSEESPPPVVHNTQVTVQKLLDEARLFGYKFKVEAVDRMSFGKQVVVVSLQPMRDGEDPSEGNAVAEGLTGRRITYVCDETADTIVNNLMDAILNEQKADVKWHLKRNGFARFSNKIPLAHLVDYASRAGS